jgi:hypothetical protein
MLLCGVLGFVLSYPLARRRVPRNRVYGIHTRMTKTGSDEVWMLVNERVGRSACVYSLLLIGAAVGLSTVPQAWIPPLVLVDILLFGPFVYVLGIVVIVYFVERRISSDLS